MEAKKTIEKAAIFAKEKIDKTKEWGKKTCENVGDFLLKNPQIIVPIIAGSGMLISNITKLADGNYDHCKIRDTKWTECVYVTTHPLTNQEICELDRRLSLGETKGQALFNMGVLRNERRRK